MRHCQSTPLRPGRLTFCLPVVKCLRMRGAPASILLDFFNQPHLHTSLTSRRVHVLIVHIWKRKLRGKRGRVPLPRHAAFQIRALLRGWAEPLVVTTAAAPQMLERKGSSCRVRRSQYNYCIRAELQRICWLYTDAGFKTAAWVETRTRKTHLAAVYLGLLSGSGQRAVVFQQQRL